jgi:hypothetical protein
MVLDKEVYQRSLMFSSRGYMKFLIIVLLTPFFYSCNGSMSGSSSSPSYHDQRFHANGVKLISKNIDDPRDQRTVEEAYYTLNNNNRLLTRLEGMNDRTNRAVVDGTNRMYLVLSSKDFIDNKTAYATTLEICPLTKNWMLMATWRNAHPFPTANSRWGQAGGDHADYDCMTADLSYADQAEDELYFDVSDWFIYYVQSRGKNYGLLIKTSEELTIYGDNNSRKGPHFTWKAN